MSNGVKNVQAAAYNGNHVFFYGFVTPQFRSLYIPQKVNCFKNQKIIGHSKDICQTAPKLIKWTVSEENLQNSYLNVNETILLLIKVIHPQVL